jgi:hypothetical protein
VDYKALARTAKNLIRKNGTKAVLRTPNGEPHYDHDTDEYIQDYDQFPGVCVVSGYEESVIDGTLIEANDKKLSCVFPADPVPKQSLVDVYKKNGNLDSTYLVINSNPIEPDAATTVMVKIQGRKL